MSIAFCHIFIKIYHTKAKRKAAPFGTAFPAKNAGEDMTWTTHGYFNAWVLDCQGKIPRSAEGARKRGILGIADWESAHRI